MNVDQYAAAAISSESITVSKGEKRLNSPEEEDGEASFFFTSRNLDAYAQEAAVGTIPSPRQLIEGTWICVMTASMESLLHLISQSHCFSTILRLTEHAGSNSGRRRFS